MQYSTVQYSTVQYSTVQYSTVQYSTVQYSTVQYSTVPYLQLHHGERKPGVLRVGRLVRGSDEQRYPAVVELVIGDIGDWRYW